MVIVVLAAFALILSVPAAAQEVIKTCAFGASGDACVFDLTATADGVLSVDTKAGSNGDKWRATTFLANKKSAKSNVSTGSATTFTGLVGRNVQTGRKYELAVTYETPLPGTFPATVTVRVNGPVSVSEQRPVSSFLAEGQSCQQVAESTFTAAVDVENISCGALLTCRFDPAGDTDAFTFMAAGGAAHIKIAEVPVESGSRNARWDLFGPSGLLGGSSGADEQALPQAGAYTIETRDTFAATGDYALSVGGVSTEFQCGISSLYGDLKVGKLDNRADTDTFQFVAVAGDIVSINVTELPAPSPQRNARWDLYSPTGSPLGGSSGSGQVGPLAASGTYTIVVLDTFNAIGDYSLSLQKVSGP
jgi:hypothetical protein